MQQTTGTTTVPTRDAAPTASAVVERPAVLDLPLPTGGAPAGTPIFDELLAQRRTTFALATRTERAPAAKAANGPKGAKPATRGLPQQKDQPAPSASEPTKAAAAR